MTLGVARGSRYRKYGAPIKSHRINAEYMQEITKTNIECASNYNQNNRQINANNCQMIIKYPSNKH